MRPGQTLLVGDIYLHDNIMLKFNLVVIDPHHANDPEITDDDPATFDGLYFGSLSTLR